VSRRAAFAPSAVAGATRLTPEAREQRRFIRDAAAESRFALEASKIAMTRSNNSAVRSFAAALINHHNVVGLELLHLLHSRGMAPPMLANDQRKALNRLAKLSSGAAFDKTYMERVGRQQGDDVREFEKASLAMHEPQIKAWIDKTLPTMRYYQMMAERTMPGDHRLARSNQGARATAVSAARPIAPPSQPGPRALAAGRPVLPRPLPAPVVRAPVPMPMPVIRAPVTPAPVLLPPPALAAQPLATRISVSNTQ
jgi:predicted outer membrane protein